MAGNKMFNLFEKVLIKERNLPGTIVDITTINGRKVITVESDIEGKQENGYGDRFPLFECCESELQRLTTNEK